MQKKALQNPLSNFSSKHFLRVRDHLVSNHLFDLYHDTEWDMLFTHPQPNDLSVYYESKNYKPHQSVNKSLWDYIYHFIRNQSFRYKLLIIKKFHPDATSLLDYGTGTGEFLHYLHKKDFIVSGVEPNNKAREQANILLNNRIKVSINEIEDRFDIISMWHVLEHLPQPISIIKKLKERLHSDGLLIVAVPNFKSFDASHYGSSWAAYDVPRHLWHFSPKSIRHLFDKCQMEVIAQKPLYFDSFYVSWLSEQYKTGKKRVLHGFSNGLISNFKALKSGDFSSLIYVIRKK